MGLEQIGLQAIFQDANFQAGIKRYEQGINQATSATDRGAGIMSRLGSVASGALVVGLGAATAAVGAFAAASKIGIDSAMAWGEQLDKLGDMFGMTGPEASKWAEAMSHVGVSVDEGAAQLNYFTRQLDDVKKAGSGGLVPAKTPEQIQSIKEQLADANTQLERAKKRMADAKKPTEEMGYAVADAQKKIARLNADLAEGSKLVAGKEKELTPFQKALQTLGVSAFDAKGKLKTFDQLMPQIMDKFQKLPPGVNATALAMDLFGARGGSKFLDFLRQGSKGLEDAKKKAHALGLDLSTDDVNALEEFGFTLNDTTDGIKGFWTQIGIHLLPIAKKLFDFINSRVLPVLVQWARDVMPRVTKALEGFSKWIDIHVLPVLDDLWNIIQDVVGIFTDFNKPVGDASNQLEAFAADVATLANALGFGGFDVEGAILGIADAISKISDAFKKGGLAGGLGEIGNQLKTAFQNVDWNKVLTGLDTLKTNFWNWLTGKGGALEKAGTELGKVKDKIIDWASKNGPAVWGLIEKWAGNFWNWLTDSKSGAIVTVFDTMDKLTQKIKAWSEAPETVKQLQGIGESVANTILDGIGRVFDSKPGAENLLLRLARSIWNARTAVIDFFASTGSSLASGLVLAIAKKFIDPATAQQLADSFGTMIKNILKFVLSGGILLWFVDVFHKELFDALNKAMGGITSSGTSGFGSGGTVTSGGNAGAWGGTGEKYANGGFVRTTGMALVHRGEYVIPAPNVSNSRVNNFNFSHNWPASVPASAHAWTESMVRTVTQQEVRTILDKI